LIFYFYEEGNFLKLHQHYVAAIISETDYYQPIGLT